MQSLLGRAWRPLRMNFRMAHSEAGVNAGKQLLASAPNELLLYYTNLYFPIRIYNQKFCKFVERTNYSDVADAVSQSFPADLEVSVLKTVPRPTEGAAFVKVACADIDKVAEVAARGFRRQWLFFSHRVKGFEVLGVPSLTQTPPPLSGIVQVSPALDATTLDELMHGYGRIRDIDSGSVKFAKPQSAITARHCLNRYKYRDAELVAVLARTPTLVARFSAWFSGHLRFTLPLLVFLLIGLAGLVFDPVREYCISSKIQGSTTLSWLAKYTKRYLGWASSASLLGLGGRSRDDEDAASQGRALNRLAKSADQLRSYLEESEPTFVVVYGPHGSGKDRIVDLEVPQKSDLVLNIDCTKLSDAQGDERKLSAFSRMIGYWPAFPWANRIARLVDLELKGLTGQPAGISETTDQQSLRILDKARNALHRLALRNKSDPKQSEEDYLEMNAASRPVIVIRGYASGEHLPEQLIEWASDLIVGNIARVVLVTRDASFDRTLAAALPNRPPRIVNVEDASLDEAHRFVLSKLDPESANDAAKRAFEAFARLEPAFIRPLGGRFTDLQMYARRLTNGEMPEVALRNQVAQAALGVSLQFLRARDAAWTSEQAWTLVNLLGSSSDTNEGWVSVPGCVDLTTEFKNADTQAVLEALEAQEMISVRSHGGRIIGIKPSRPLVMAAFQMLAADDLTSTEMNSKVYAQQIKRELAQISKVEEELGVLASAPAKSREVGDRQTYLCAKLGSSQQRVSDLEAKAKAEHEKLMRLNPSDYLSGDSEQSFS